MSGQDMYDARGNKKSKSLLEKPKGILEYWGDLDTEKFFF
jgi:hypothetical protein